VTATVWELVADQFDPTKVRAGWEPQPKQALAEKMSRSVDELLYGGAVGGGKTEWGVEHVIGEMERHAGNRGGIFRRVYPSLNRTVVPRLKMKLHGRALWNGNEMTFTFPNGSVIELGALQHPGRGPEDPGDAMKYQGTEYGVIFFEEVTEFLEKQWEYMLTRLRAPVDGVRPHAIATTNPGGVGHRWVKRRWVSPPAEHVREGNMRPKPGRSWRPRATTDRPDPLVRAFVPATLEDNPKLLERDPNYERRLDQVSNRGLRQALRSGDWDAIDTVEGALWTPEDLDGGRVHEIPVTVARRGIALDPSDGDEGGDDFGVALGALGMDAVLYVEGSEGWSGTPKQLARRSVQLYHDTGCDVMIVEKNHGGKWVPALIRTIDPRVNIVTTWASEKKKTRAEPVASLFEHNRDRERPYLARMVGFHDELEAELTNYTGLTGEVSPNRLDALVWLGNELAIKRRQVYEEEYDDQRLQGRR
jgi:hypothetical protein